MRKFWIERWVWAPQSLSAGTSMGPKVSVSVRVDGDILTSFHTAGCSYLKFERVATPKRAWGLQKPMTRLARHPRVPPARARSRVRSPPGMLGFLLALRRNPLTTWTERHFEKR